METRMSRFLETEDKEDKLRILIYPLERSGHAPISAGRGDAGATLALRERPDFIQKDINMPGMDGVETTGRMTVDPLTIVDGLPSILEGDGR
jgi:DNA-binding response OmpR family regulator